MRFLFCNTGRMEKYQGLDAGDTITGGGAYVKEKGHGHEVCNFSSYKNRLFSYVQARGNTIDIRRLGAKPGDTSVGGITVVWTATRPGGGTAIIGWYRNATVFMNYQTFKTAPPVQAKNMIDGYWIKAPADQAICLPVDARIFEIPRRVKGGMGQSNIWYADKTESAKTISAVSDFINSSREPGSRRNSRRGTPDQEKKALVEKVAIRTCCDHFERLGYEVTSVETDNMGWDLKARAGRMSLRIEVKGLSGSVFGIELTPNEFNAFSEKAHDYRLVVVTNALAIPELFICRYSKELCSWVIEGDEVGRLDIDIRQSASIRRSK